MEKVHPDILEKIYNLLTKSKIKPSLNELSRRFCPNVSKYEGKILIRLFYIFDDNSCIFLSNEVLEIEDFRKIKWDDPIHMGKISNKKDVYLTLNDMIIGVFEDPYMIYTFVETHEDLVVEECGYLHKFLERNT